MVKVLNERGKRRIGIFIPVDDKKPVEPGVIYEHRIKTRWLPDWIIDPVVRGILSLQEMFQGLELLYYKVERGEIIYQFRFPPEKQITIPHPVAYAIIGVILAIVALFLVDSIFGKIVEMSWVLFPLAVGIAMFGAAALLREVRVKKPP